MSCMCSVIHFHKHDLLRNESVPMNALPNFMISPCLVAGNRCHVHPKRFSRNNSKKAIVNFSFLFRLVNIIPGYALVTAGSW